MRRLDKFRNKLKKESPTILAVIGSIGTGVTAYLAAKNEAEYQKKRFKYYLENGIYPEELCCEDLSKEEIRSKAYKLFGVHLKYHISTFISGGLTIASILCGNAAGKKQNAALMAMNVGIGNMMARRNCAENELISNQSEKSKKRISREDIQDYLISEAYNNNLVYYTNINEIKDNEEFVWLDIYPENKILIVNHDDVSTLQWFINNALNEQDTLSYGEIFDYLGIYKPNNQDFYDEDINEWIYMYGFSKDHEEQANIEVYTRIVTVDDGTPITVLSFSSTANVIQYL